MKRFVSTLDKVLYVLSVIFTVGFLSTVVIQVFSRTFLPQIPSWTEEMSRYLFVYAVAFAGGLVVRRSEYVMVDFITSKFSPFFKKVQRIVVYLVLIAFNSYLMIFSLPKFVFIKFRMVSTALEIPMQFIYFSLFLFFGLQVLCYLLQLILEISGKADPVKEVTAL